MKINQTDQGLGLSARRNLIEPLIDCGGGDVLPFDGNGLRIAGVAVDELLDLAGEGGGEKNGLPFLRCGVKDTLDVLTEAHIEHPVGLVEDGNLELIELEGAAFEVVDDAPRGADDDLDSFPEFKELSLVGGAAVDGNGMDGTLESSELMHLIGHLLGQFTGRAEDEHLDRFAGRIDLLDGWNGESRRFSGAGL